MLMTIIEVAILLSFFFLFFELLSIAHCCSCYLSLLLLLHICYAVWGSISSRSN